MRVIRMAKRQGIKPQELSQDDSNNDPAYEKRMGKE
jgi:hypothetical protein